MPTDIKLQVISITHYSVGPQIGGCPLSRDRSTSFQWEEISFLMVREDHATIVGEPLRIATKILGQFTIGETYQLVKAEGKL